ncbi:MULTISPECIES: very short patch repair endonuclease [unclassified Pseudomonas]|uniref:very short patch repair endonuclease n=1 Tax=unclassified Pseudomonas TaxID=196821 RepID=UPI000C8693DA|nr:MULTISPECIES: DNA mismatch endonuclease Vsr [unclassified Pseudomonas]PMV85181.1 very short patch repair endonuclease [Pseudomonas sp. GW101-1A09]PMV94079.1 very short patch repair endonuclease [Pseudomonas sp. FW306-2-2C-B10A]PMV94414.1 very short patch repair endonuclease [Pseudomonas sp. GW460-C8]PMW04186.1 very short patch repair endonuclease [Pseudomonas sp. MPR-TSA4]PMW14574.1 very short patch repair endonuclease [Pseudomonas sp. GW456-11-11-14-TSB2]
MDIVDSATRSRMMAAIRGKNTGPEIVVRRYLHALGYRFRIHRKDLPGKPDIVMPKLRTCIFVHGCFWHRHPDCRYAYAPKSRLDFWLPKFAKTVERDLAAQNALHELGWNVVIIWECETKKIELLRQKINEALAASS